MALSYGARVTISGPGEPKVARKVEEFRSPYPHLPASAVEGFACDLGDRNNLETNLTSLLDRTTTGDNRINHIDFTAGDRITLPKVNDFTADNLLAGFTVRTIAPALLAKLLASADYMPRPASSSISLTGGTNTHRPPPNWTVGALIGVATEGLAQGLAVDLAPIRVNIVNPGGIHRELFQGSLDRSTPKAFERIKKENSLLGEFWKPDDIAGACRWLKRDRFAIGVIANSDGGRLLVGTGGSD